MYDSIPLQRDDAYDGVGRCGFPMSLYAALGLPGDGVRWRRRCWGGKQMQRNCGKGPEKYGQIAGRICGTRRRASSSGFSANRWTRTRDPIKSFADAFLSHCWRRIATQAQAERMIKEHYFNSNASSTASLYCTVNCYYAMILPFTTMTTGEGGSGGRQLNFLVYLGIRNYQLPRRKGRPRPKEVEGTYSLDALLKKGRFDLREL